MSSIVSYYFRGEDHERNYTIEELPKGLRSGDLLPPSQITIFGGLQEDGEYTVLRCRGLVVFECILLVFSVVQ